MRITACPTKEIGATFFKRSKYAWATNPDGDPIRIQYIVKACEMFGEFDNSGFHYGWTNGETGEKHHTYYPCDEKFATTTYPYKKNSPQFVDNNFCTECRFSAHAYIQPWAEHLSGVRGRKTDYTEEKYIWYNYVIPFGKYLGKRKQNYWK